MAEAAKDQDQSMEEILQSIKRIIAEEGEPAPAASEVLELTDMLADDGSITQPDKHAASAIPMMSIDEIMAAPVASDPAPKPAAAVPAPPPQPARVAPIAAAAEDESLISETTRAASMAALRELESVPAPAPAAITGTIPFRSGSTVEDMVVEALKPMLKDWLDGNLSGIVERLVEKEIRKLSQR
jgi:cell pole-organizing protein PopZ